MKWIRVCGAVLATLSWSAAADAGLLGGCGAEKSCGCAADNQPCCQPKIMYRPVICRPTTYAVHTYQRQCLKPSSCDSCAPSKSCGKKACKDNCGAKNGCGTDPASCAAPAACAPAPAKCAAPAPATCAAPAACAPAPAKCAAPAPATCAAPAPAACAPAPAAKACAPAATACGPMAKNCGAKSDCCAVDTCEIAHQIYVSQTACYATERRSAIRRLARYSCVCNPEIMCAFVYGLNDADERVRLAAADALKDQLKKNPCCCNDRVTSALICALGDCDKKVRREAEKALEACGYEVADCCDQVCSVPSCGAKACGPAPAGDAAPMPTEEAAPAPAPPAEGDAFFPSRLPQQQTRKTNRLANLFGLR